MKKTLIALAFATSFSALAAEVDVSYLTDKGTSKNGERVTVASTAKIAGITPIASITHVSDAYNRYSIGGQANVFDLGAMKIAAQVTGVWQDSAVGSNGFGMTAGLRGEVPVTKDCAITLGAERFVGQTRINGYDANLLSVGAAYKF